MSYTKFGEFARILRIKNHEVMGDMAKVLGVSVSFLSSVENGKKNVPEGWLDTISEKYALDSVEREALEQSIDESRLQMKINLAKAQDYQRSVAVRFARSFEDMDQETAKRIMELLEGAT